MFSLAFTCLLCLTAAPDDGPALTVVRDGKTDWVIVLPQGATAPVRHGAEEIQKHLKMMTGAELPIVEPKGAQPGSPILLRLDETLGSESFRIDTTPAGITISGDARRGLLYGCYAFLEDVVGCRWYTSRITKVPKKATLTVGPLHISQKPAFEYREPYYTEAFDRDWAVRNRTNGNAQHLDDSVGGKVQYGPFVHTFSSLVPTEQVFR